jgi:hypothetical protein
MVGRLLGVGLSKLQTNHKALRAALDKAVTKKAWRKIRTRTPGTTGLAGVEAEMKRWRPHIVILDQLRNFHMPGKHNRTNDLDMVAREARRLGATYNAVMVSLTQASDDARDSLILNTGHVDSSNIGIPSQADLMIGINFNDDYYRTNRRMISLPKNKLGGSHHSFSVNIDREHSRYFTRKAGGPNV